MHMHNFVGDGGDMSLPLFKVQCEILQAWLLFANVAVTMTS